MLRDESQHKVQLLLGGESPFYTQAQVWTVERGNECFWRFQFQLLYDVISRYLVGSCRECHNGHAGKLIVEYVKACVLGAEVVTPLGNAMSLVDGE